MVLLAVLLAVRTGRSASRQNQPKSRPWARTKPCAQLFYSFVRHGPQVEVPLT